MSLHEHTAEVYGVDWNFNTKNLISSAAWDHTVKVWDVMAGVCVRTFMAHQQIAYAAIWSPARPACVATVAGDASATAADAGIMTIETDALTESDFDSFLHLTHSFLTILRLI